MKYYDSGWLGEAFPEESTFELRPEGGERGATGDLGKVNSRCKGPEAGMSMECLGNSEKATVAGAQ